MDHMFGNASKPDFEHPFVGWKLEKDISGNYDISTHPKSMAQEISGGKQKPLKVLAAILRRDGRLLIAKRKKGERFGGHWEFPGGKLEPGENPEECLAREMREEFGMEARVGGFLGSIRYSSSSLSIELSAYAVVHISGDFRLYDHDEIRWVTPEDCENYPLTEPDRVLLRELAAAGVLREDR
jgi:8-oxo-dGTP diphosphatase